MVKYAKNHCEYNSFLDFISKFLDNNNLIIFNVTCIQFYSRLIKILEIAQLHSRPETSML